MTIQRYLLTLFLFAALITAAPLGAEESTEKWIVETTLSLKTIEQQFKSESEHLVGDDDQLKELTQIKGKAQTCVDESSEALKKTSSKLEALGQPAVGESSEVLAKRSALQQEQRELDKRLNACNLLLIQSSDIADEINKRHAAELAEKLFSRGPHLGAILQHNLKQPTAWWQPGIDYLIQQVQLKSLGSTGKIILFFLFIVGVALGIFLKKIIRENLTAQSHKHSDSYSGFTIALRSCLASVLPLLLPLVFCSAYLVLLVNENQLEFIHAAIISTTLYILLLIVIKAVFSPCPPATHYISDPPELGRQLGRRLIITSSIAWLGYLFFTTELKNQFDEQAYFFIRSILLTLLVINLTAIIWLARRFSWSLLPNGLRLMITLGLVVVLITDFTGHRNFSRYLLSGIAGSMFGLALTVMANRFFADLFDQLDHGLQNWQKKIRSTLGLKSGERIPGLAWLRLLVFICLWGLFIILVLRVWGQSEQGETIILETLTQGFEIGTIRIVPSRLLLALLLFAVVINLTRLIKQSLSKRWIKHTNLDRGAQEAMVTISGYVGFILALMIALSTAGIEFKNLAIVAGALSVGIGFGLQNIVNNFVSGLILLFERPIRRGDWIVVGNTEGFVKSINIRSTEIQTFDRADVIVPNSELISSQVTNWVLHDATGRVILPVSVAYGSNTEEVKNLLLKIANEHPEVISDSSYISPPSVLFRKFGDSALEFELRCYIRDINHRLTAVSELNFAVDKVFREAGIEIPFPQRDIHIIKQKNDHDEQS
ncbi:MAG TPA: mechanosensitive ion channel family protein [Chromatiales bacterium]|nr:mechanosensitive ion channel family protein [Chromatiales bacterium]